MKLPSLLFLLFAFLDTTAQKPLPCICKGFVDTSYNGLIYLKDSPKGKVTATISQQHKKGDYLLFDISKVVDSFFFVKMKYTKSGIAYEGWIKKGTYLNTFVKRDSLELTLFYEASYTSKVKTKTSNKMLGPFQILNCTQNWLYIKKIDKGSKLEGWINSKDQCPNPSTICK